jgi:hypothetical protein
MSPGVGARATGAAMGGAGARATALRRVLQPEEGAETGQRLASLSCVSPPFVCQVMN